MADSYFKVAVFTTERLSQEMVATAICAKKMPDAILEKIAAVKLHLEAASPQSGSIGGSRIVSWVFPFDSEDRTAQKRASDAAKACRDRAAQETGQVARLTHWATVPGKSGIILRDPV